MHYAPAWGRASLVFETGSNWKQRSTAKLCGRFAMSSPMFFQCSSNVHQCAITIVLSDSPRELGDVWYDFNSLFARFRLKSFQDCRWWANVYRAIGSFTILRWWLFNGKFFVSRSPDVLTAALCWIFLNEQSPLNSLGRRVLVGAPSTSEIHRPTKCSSRLRQQTAFAAAGREPLLERKPLR